MSSELAKIFDPIVVLVVLGLSILGGICGYGIDEMIYRRAHYPQTNFSVLLDKCLMGIFTGMLAYLIFWRLTMDAYYTCIAIMAFSFLGNCYAAIVFLWKSGILKRIFLTGISIMKQKQKRP